MNIKKFLIVVPVLGVLAFIIFFAIGSRPGYKNIPSNPQAAASCPDPLVLQTPVDVSLATSILYPGQTRGGDFKKHGGFRFDKSDNAIEVRAPIDATLVSASQYIEQGEVQYLLDFESACGVRYRFDHLFELSPKIATALQVLPPAKPDDTRTTFLDGKTSVKTNELIATEVGFRQTKNVSVDFGVYEISSNQEGLGDGVCWFDLLPSKDASVVRSLPAGDATSGTTSEYCK